MMPFTGFSTSSTLTLWIRHHYRAKIGDKFALPLPKIRTYRFPFHTSRLSLHGEVTRDGSDVTIVALKLAINLHFPLPKIRTYRFPFHTSRLSLHGEVTRDGSDVTIVALKLAINLHFPLPKIRTYRFPLHTSRLSLHGEVTSMKHRKTRSN